MTKRSTDTRHNRDSAAKGRQKKAPRDARSGGGRSSGDASSADAATASAGIATQFLGVQHKLWNAGLSALSRGGNATSAKAGLKKLEDVFDQRIMNSLSNSGMPSPAELRRLIEWVESLSIEVSRLKRKAAKS